MINLHHLFSSFPVTPHTLNVWECCRSYVWPWYVGLLGGQQISLSQFSALSEPCAQLPCLSSCIFIFLCRPDPVYSVQTSSGASFSPTGLYPDGNQMKDRTLWIGKLMFSAQLEPGLSFRILKQSRGWLSCSGLFANKTLRKIFCGSERLSQRLQWALPMSCFHK